MKLKSNFLSIITLSLFLTQSGYSQTSSIENKRYIEVIGSSEMSIKPDEIEILFSLQEYRMKGNKEKVDLNTIQSEFFVILEKYGLKEKDIIIANYNSYGVDWYSWKVNKRLDLRYKKFSIVIDSSINLPNLINDLDKEWLESISITKLRNKNEQALRKEVKIQAIKAAKDKAAYLLAAIGEDLGKVISVEEVKENIYTRDLSSNTVTTSIYDNSNNINNTSSIKLRYEMKVKFEVK